MPKIVTIDPVTRIEGHAKVTILLGDNGQVQDARFHVVEFRGFEKFCVGRTFWEMPGITARVCGICPVSHLMASAKAGDNILGVRVPARAEKLRRLMNWGQMVQSHALSFFHLSSPDLLLGMESEPGARNVVGLIQANPDLARRGIRLRQYGQDIIRQLGGKSVHPAWTVPGGVRTPMTPEARDAFRRGLPEAFETTNLALDLLKDLYPKFEREAATYGDFETLFMGLVSPDGGLEHYDGLLKVMDPEGRVLELADPRDFRRFVGEAVQPWTYLKFPYYLPAGYPRGSYRVGPLARLNICDFAGTARADRELRQFRRLGTFGRPVSGSFHYHYARLIEILHCLERIEEVLEDESLGSGPVRAHSDVNELRGVGVSEAPRGTLFHEYEVDENGILKYVNLIIATGQNNAAMNQTVKQIAQAYVDGKALSEGILNRIEHGVRLFDPCLSCSTHAAGQMPLEVELLGTDGTVLDTVRRG